MRVCPATAVYRKMKARESLSRIWMISTMCLLLIRYFKPDKFRLWKDDLCGCISHCYFCVFGRNVTLRSTKFSWCPCVPSRCRFLLLNFSWTFQQLHRNSVDSSRVWVRLDATFALKSLCLPLVFLLFIESRCICHMKSELITILNICISVTSELF